MLGKVLVKRRPFSLDLGNGVLNLLDKLIVLLMVKLRDAVLLLNRGGSLLLLNDRLLLLLKKLQSIQMVIQQELLLEHLELLLLLVSPELVELRREQGVVAL